MIVCAEHHPNRSTERAVRVIMLLFPRLLVSALVAGATLAFGPFVVEASRTPDQPVVETWDPLNGWLALPAAPMDAPELSWELDLLDAHVAIAADTVVTMSEADGSSSVRGVDAITGAVSWSTELSVVEAVLLVDRTGSVAHVSGSTPDGDSLVTVFDAATGETLWTQTQEGGFVNVEVMDDIILVDNMHETRVLDRPTGNELWTDKRDITATSGHVATYDVRDGSVQLLDPRSGDTVWAASHAVTAGFAVVDDVVLVSEVVDDEVLVTARRVADGDELWSAPLPIRSLSSDNVPAPLGGNLAVVPAESGDELIAIDLATGNVVWQQRVEFADFRAEFRVDGTTYLVTEVDGSTVVLDAASGDTLHDLDRVLFGDPAGGAYYDVGTAGEVLALELPGFDERWSVSVDTIGAVTPIEGGFVFQDMVEPGRIAGYHSDGNGER